MKRIKFTLAAVAAMFAGLAAFADETISADTTLAADRTVSGTLYLADGVTLDLNGHNLTANAIAATDDDDVPGYKFLEYIQSDGHQWLYSNYTPNYTDKVVMRLNFTAMVTGRAWVTLFCSRGPNTTMPFMCSIQGGVQIRVDHRNSGSATQHDFTTTTDLDYTYMVDGKTGDFAVNAVTNKWAETGSTTWEATGPFSILGAHTVGADLASKRGTNLDLLPSCKLYSFQVYDESGALQCDMVPAKRTSDGEIGMYDKARSQFIENYGTMAFVAGPRAVDVIEAAKKYSDFSAGI